MYRPSSLRKPQNQATWAILVIRIVFYDITSVRYCLLHLRNADFPNDALVNSMLGELILPPQYLAPDFLKDTHDRILFHRSLLVNRYKAALIYIIHFPFWASIFSMGLMTVIVHTPTFLAISAMTRRFRLGRGIEKRHDLPQYVDDGRLVPVEAYIQLDRPLAVHDVGGHDCTVLCESTRQLSQTAVPGT